MTKKKAIAVLRAMRDMEGCELKSITKWRAPAEVKAMATNIVLENIKALEKAISLMD